MRVVVVESPAKAKTINKYLGDDFTVLASFGHVRDLVAKDGAVDPDQDFSMKWEIGPKSEKHVREITEAVRKADAVYLATDPDREGEAISWHVRDVLAGRKVLGDKPVHRITFNAITKAAVTNAMAAPRDLHQELVEAYLARRALDYLVGFTLSPVLWRKLPGSRSAGRVQSVALRLICEREAEIERFKEREYWSVEALMATTAAAGGQPFTARLTHLNGAKLDKFDLPDAAAAQTAVAAIEGTTFSVGKVERKTARRNPAPPFTTSTLQQEASRKLYFSASRTMSVAQRLYEGIALGGETVGLITYMRTDGVQMAPEAIQGARATVEREFGARYVPDSPRVYKTKAKNAQEAHEAIRPTDPGRTPAMVAPYVSKEQLALYELVWKRTIASQMASAELDQVAVDLTAANGAATLRATGSVITFDGFLKVYHEGRDDIGDAGGDSDDESNRILPPLTEGDAVDRREVRSNQHFTQPPPRYSEASLVKKMEELGIGRPSTYASVLSVLQDRDYVRLDSRRFVPEDRGRIVTAFLENFFARYVEYSFTADLENKLDEISAGSLNYRAVLREFWSEFKSTVDEIQGLRVSEVLDALDAELGPHLFPPPEDESGPDPRACPSCGEGRLGLRLGKFGAFVGCSNYPTCRFTRQLVATNEDDGGADDLAAGPRLLGTDPETGKAVTLRKGPYGLYVQLGEQEQIGETKAGKPKMGPKPPRASLPRGLDADRVDLQVALGLLALPRDVDVHPDDGTMIQAGLGRFGPYLKHGDVYKSLPKDDDPLLVLTIGLNRAVDLLAQQSGGRTRMAARSLGDHPSDGKPVTLKDGRFGPYVEHGKARASLLKADRENIEGLTLERAIELIRLKAEKDAAKAQGTGAVEGSSGGAAAKGKATGKATTKATGKTAKAASSGKSATSKTKAKAAKASEDGSADTDGTTGSGSPRGRKAASGR
ncbi:type I DNA topoisomerase [Roseospira marina]|uniref:DNA topoisomerase 1 n=1 Tax=Roseospira marina TaxID=140057 RepID=A0A5M6IDT5_9PROT|nr:type I DNA topoisomerase [Roseospira marina]KAA5605885.1 type I DNA topoisomerase [Roseospira marina]MBB4313708.1 DNA topoisomerase-1 [Roseospira marina]MBB5086870.1 DNA topoisomerase-1 [Roseospira marina]